MFNNKFPKDGKQIYINDEKRLRNLNKEIPIIIYIHGFTESTTANPKSSAMEVRDGLLLNFQ